MTAGGGGVGRGEVVEGEGGAVGRGKAAEEGGGGAGRGEEAEGEGGAAGRGEEAEECGNSTAAENCSGRDQPAPAGLLTVGVLSNDMACSPSATPGDLCSCSLRMDGPSHPVSSACTTAGAPLSVGLGLGLGPAWLVGRAVGV